MSRNLLTLFHITTGYGKKQVINDISFSIAENAIVLLTGGNGSGKSTVLKTIYGLLKPWNSNGRITFADSDITAMPTDELIQRGIVYVPQKDNVFDDFTVEENLQISSSIYPPKKSRQRIERVFDESIPHLASLRKRTTYHLSGGERQLLAFANVLVHIPKLCLLDEPLAGVDAENSTLLINTIKKLNETGTTFLIVEHSTTHFPVFSYRENIRLKLGTIKSREEILP